MRTGRHSRHQDDVAGEHVEQRQRTDDVVFFRKQQSVTEPTVIDHAGILVLRHFRHARRAACVEVGRDTVAFAVGEIQFGVLLFDRLVEADHIRSHLGRLGADHRDDPRLWRRQITVQVNFNYGFHTGRVAHGLGHLLRHIRFRERLQRDDNLGFGFPQDRRNLFRFQQRVDRVHDARNRTTQQRQRGFVTVRQHISHHILFTDTQGPEQVCGLRHFGPQFAPCQGFGFVVGAREYLIADSRPVRVLSGCARQQTVQGRGHITIGPRHLLFDRVAIVHRSKTHRSSSQNLPGQCVRD